MTDRFLAPLRDFGVRSLVTHAIMAISFIGALVAGLTAEGELAVLSFVALLNFTAGVWVCQSIHSLGHAKGGDDYGGILEVLSRYVR